MALPLALLCSVCWPLFNPRFSLQLVEILLPLGHRLGRFSYLVRWLRRFSLLDLLDLLDLLRLLSFRLCVLFLESFTSCLSLRGYLA